MLTLIWYYTVMQVIEYHLVPFSYITRIASPSWCHLLYYSDSIIIIIIIAPLTIVKFQWGDLECLHKACRAAISDGDLFTDTGVDERCENERQGEHDCGMKTVSRVNGPENRQELVQTRVRMKGLFKKKGFEFRVKLMRGQGKKRRRISSSAE